MAYTVKPRRMETTILGIDFRESAADGDVFGVELEVNGAHYMYELRLSKKLPGAFMTSMPVFEDLRKPKGFVADYVFRFAKGETLLFPIRLGDLGAPSRL